MTPGRELLAEITGDPDLVSAISDTHPLALSGVNSGDLVRVMLALEERLGRPLSAEQVEDITTIADIEALLGPAGAAGSDAPEATAAAATGPDATRPEAVGPDAAGRG